MVVAGDNLFIAGGHEGLVIMHTFEALKTGTATSRNDGALSIEVSGPPGVRARVQTSPDPRKWTD